MMKTCPNCGKRFEANWNTRKYCGDWCRAEHRRRRRKEAAKERWAR